MISEDEWVDMDSTTLDPITLAEMIRLKEKADQQADIDYRRFMNALWAAIPISIVAWLIFFCAFSYFYR